MYKHTRSYTKFSWECSNFACKLRSSFLPSPLVAWGRRNTLIKCQSSRRPQLSCLLRTSFYSDRHIAYKTRRLVNLYARQRWNHRTGPCRTGKWRTNFTHYKLSNVCLQACNRSLVTPKQ